MEEIVTVDGRQFKLTVDRPLSALEKSQVIADIRKQSGCGTCGRPGVRTMEGRAGIATLQVCTKATISSEIGNVATLLACPNDGTAPYTVTFLGQFGAAPVVLAAGVAPYGLTGANPQVVATDGACTAAGVTYQVTDAQIVASAGGPPVVAAVPGVNGSGIGVPAGAVNTVRFLVHTADSCPTGALHCVEYCDLTIVCPTPTCNFTVS